MNNLPAVQRNALKSLQNNKAPEAVAILNYIESVKKHNIAVLGADEVFTVRDGKGEVKAFRRSVNLSLKNGTLTKLSGQFPVSAQGYEVWAEAVGASVIFPKEVLVGNEWKSNPYAERDPNNRRILAVHARAVARTYSSIGVEQVSDWSTIFDTPSYRMIDLLSKAKEFPQAFKVLPKEMTPPTPEDETWAHYPFDESMNLWINTSHDEVIKWLGQILNREKKAMDFAQTFARRNALKHLSGIQKAPNDDWTFAVVAWRQTGDSKPWNMEHYSKMQDEAAGLSSQDSKTIEIKKGTEKVSEDEITDIAESEINPEDSQETAFKSEEKQPKSEPREPSKEVKQALYLFKSFPAEFDEARKLSFIDALIPIEEYTHETAVKVCQKISELVDQQ